jgi:hypothetical protein
MNTVEFVSTTSRFAAALAAVSMSFVVHAQSAFTHQIAIKVPKGANGMQPDISLS